MRTSSRTKLALVVLAVLVVLIASVSFLVSRSNINEGRVTISNLTDCSPGINEVVVSQISTTMYMFVERANDYNQRRNEAGYTGAFRDGSCRTETTNETKNTFQTTAILDIPQAKQSWDVVYGWTSTKGNPQIDLGTIEPTCLPGSQLRYGDFKCQNVTSLIAYGTDKYDPILKYMPYSGESFNLAYDPESKTISVTVLVRPEEANNTALVNNVKAAVPQWIQQKGLNPSDYTIKYRVAAKQD